MRVPGLATAFIILGLVACHDPPTEEEIRTVTERNREVHGAEVPSLDPYRREVVIPAGRKFAGFYKDTDKRHVEGYYVWYGVVTRGERPGEPRETYDVHMYGEPEDSSRYGVAVVDRWTIIEE